jgi:hypothetical protein
MAPRVKPAPANKPSAPARKPSAPVEEENFNLDNVSDSTQDEENPKPAPTKIPETTRVTPIIKPAVKSNRALDIDLIFHRAKGEQSVCKYCKYVLFLAIL